MTAQVPDELENDSRFVDFGNRVLVGVVRGDISKGGEPYDFAATPDLPADAEFSTANWSGYVSRYRLHENTSLELESFEFRVSPDRIQTQTIKERLSGDFWLVMRPNAEPFAAATTYVPFVGGRLVVDERRWRVEAGGGRSILESIFRRPGMYTANGTSAEVFAFLAGCEFGMSDAADGHHGKAALASLRDDLAKLLAWLSASARIDPPAEACAELVAEATQARLAETFPNDAGILRAVRLFLLGWPDNPDSGTCSGSGDRGRDAGRVHAAAVRERGESADPPRRDGSRDS